VGVTILNRGDSGIVGASLFVPSPARKLYDVVLDVRNFPSWAPGVRSVEVLKGPVGPGMVSEWEVSVLGLRRRISSVLVEAEDPRFLCWTYEGAISGHGECVIQDLGHGSLAEFKTQLSPAEPVLQGLARTLLAKNAARIHLKRCLARLGQIVSGDGDAVRVGPPRTV
jgi:uncharacterized membrane protein